jgi:tetratricopeptide (TPR) repeat protein
MAFGDLVWGPTYEFVSFDDYHYVRNNPNVHVGLSVEGLSWAFTNFYAIHWHPLTWLSLQLDYELHGLNPRGFHLTNLLLHAANAVLLFLALRWSTGNVWPAAVVAALFAVHPLHVESVAWVTERKDMLSTLFWMLTLLAYCRYAERPGLCRYLLVVTCLTLGLLSKPMVVTLPCVLLLLDYWPLRRWAPLHAAASTGAVGELPTGPRFPPVSTRQLVLEKLPLLLLAAGCATLTIFAHEPLLMDSRDQLPFGWIRVLNAALSYVSYLWQMIWPSGLAAVYLHPMEKLSWPQGIAAGLLLIGITVLAVRWRTSRPYFLVGWLWYLGTLVPVIGLLQVGMHARADRFTYIPLIGVFIVLAWGGAQWLTRRPQIRPALLGAVAGALAVCIFVTAVQLRYWRNSTTLWNRVIQVSGEDPHTIMYVAFRHLAEGDTDKAILHAQWASRLQPENWHIHGFLANAFTQAGQPAEAMICLERALALEPNSIDLQRRMATTLWSLGRIPAAYKFYATVAKAEPDSADGQFYLGVKLHRQRKWADAVRCLKKAVELAPDRVLYHCDLALALEDQGDAAAAAAAYQAASGVDPDWPVQCERLAWLLATHPDANLRDGAEAVCRARQACAATKSPRAPCLEMLAAAYAEAGQFPRAVAVAEHARRLALAAAETGLMRRVDAALGGYRQRQPFRDHRFK